IHAWTCGAHRDMSTDDASSSRTSLRLRLTRSESVRIFMPASTLREHAGTRTREPSSSTTHTRHTLTGASVSSWHRVGVSMLMRRHASRIVEPSVTSTSWPSMLTATSRFGMPTKTASAIDHLQLRQPGRDRVGRRLAQAAYGRIAHRLRDVAEQHHISGAVAIGLAQHALDDLFLPLRPHPA